MYSILWVLGRNTISKFNIIGRNTISTTNRVLLRQIDAIWHLPAVNWFQLVGIMQLFWSSQTTQNKEC